MRQNYIAHFVEGHKKLPKSATEIGCGMSALLRFLMVKVTKICFLKCPIKILTTHTLHRGH
jgi:hypothetical protein